MDKKIATTGAAINKKHTNDYIGFPETRAMAAGRWGWIHTALGINLQSNSHRKHTLCPGCGGKDRFRIDKSYPDTGRWLCSGGGDFQQGDGFALLGHVFGWSHADQLGAVKRVLGLADHMTNTQRRTLQRQAEAYQAAMTRQVKEKEERFRRDSNLLDCIAELESIIHFRQHCQRVVNRAVSPSDDEQQAAHQLNAYLLESYRMGSAA